MTWRDPFNNWFGFNVRSSFFIALVFAAMEIKAETLPAIISEPQNQTVSLGGTATLSVVAGNANAFQWRFNGIDIPASTGSTLQITNAQGANAGYYMVIVKNDTGWVPSQLAYLTIDYFPSPGGTVPFSNIGAAQAVYQYGPWFGMPITNGTAQLFVGPQLDQMRAGPSTTISNGYFNASNRTISTVAPGQTLYYRINLSYPEAGSYIQLSTVLKLIAGGNGNPAPSVANLKFPTWPEWPEPWLVANDSLDQIRIAGETFSITNSFVGYNDFGVPTWQWRKDGTNIGTVQNFTGASFQSGGIAVLTITNAQPSDAGIYDVVVLGNNWFIGPKTKLSIQVVNGQGLFQSVRKTGTNFVANLVGAPRRNYAIEGSTNLALNVWSNLTTVSNVSGTTIFSNGATTGKQQFYRARLLP